MLESILSYIGTLDTGWIYLILFLFAFIENVFPPSPSDVVVVVGASLIASTSLAFVPILVITSVGSSMGFVLMHYLGKIFGEKIIRKGKLSFIKPESLAKPDAWFSRYGYKLILANRFLPGTRSVISFFSGIHELDPGKTFINATISAFVWNVIIIYLGMVVGNNVEQIDYYLSTYSNIVGLITVIVISIIVVRFFMKRKKTNSSA